MYNNHDHDHYYYTNPFWDCNSDAKVHYGKIMTLSNLAEIVSRLGWEYDLILKLIQTVYKNSGDLGIIILFYEMTNIRRGHYIMTYQKYS